MIGVIGPLDSVALTLSVADELGIADQVVGRPYRAIADALDVALELDPVCQVLLFTGRVPYAIGRSSGVLRATLRFVPHGGADLYRALVHLLRTHHGELPRISLDTIESAIVTEAYADLGLEPPSHVLELEEAGQPVGLRPADDIVAYHLDATRRGDVDVCVTCLGEVDRSLRAAGVQTFRISHTRSALREALEQASLAARLAITEVSQPAAVLVRASMLARTTSGGSTGGTSYDVQRRRLRIREVILDLAERVQGRLVDLDETTFVIYTNRGTIDGAISRLLEGHGSPFDPTVLPAGIHVGVGLGATVSAAEEHARRALAMGERDGVLHVVHPDGAVVRASDQGPASTLRLREMHAPTLEVARELGLGPLALARLTQALRQVDTSAVTAAELARAYGIEPRSARRMMTALQRAGIATALGRQGGPGAGRPQTVYRIDVARLVPAAWER